MLPEWLDYALSENTAFAMMRGLRGLSANWGELIATAQAIMGIYQDIPPEKVEDLYEEEHALPLIAASRILDAASQASSGLPLEDRENLRLSSAVAFGMYGNFPSARAMICQMRIKDIDSSTAAIIATAAPNCISDMLSRCYNKTPEKRYLELLGSFLYMGDLSLIDTIREAFIECILAAPSSFESSLLRSCKLCLEHIFTLSVARTLHQQCPNLPSSYISQLIDRGVKVFLPPQFKAIVHYQLPTNSNNTIVALPTSTGKTLLGELCLIAALQQKPGIVCYLAPYIALGRQVVQSFKDHLPDSFRIHPLLGGFREVEQLDPENHMEVLVATPERLDALLRTSRDIVPHFRCMVCDEAHLVQNDIRGVRLEGILTRFRLLQNSGYPIRLILLSAVLSQYNKLRLWLGGPKTSVVTDSWRPTARRLAFWKQNGRLIWYVGDDPIRRPKSTSSSTIGECELPWPENQFELTQHFGMLRKQEPLAYANVAYLTEVLSKSYGGPILCVCATKEGTRKVALALSRRFPAIEILPKSIESIITRIESRYRFLLPMCKFLKSGVAYHNSTVPHEIRQLIEDAIKDRDLTIVAATTTLAEGVDFPFRFTILVDWLMWQGSEQSPMQSLLFRNVAGRCGRSGVFTEGDTIVFDNPLGEIKYTHPYFRAGVQNSIFLAEKPEELTSAVQSLFNATSEPKESLVATLSSQFMAAIPENPDVDDLVEKFAENTFVFQQLSQDAPIRRVLNNIKESLLDNTKNALAIAASPLRLTPFGEAANITGFSPNSCRFIIEFLQKMSAIEQDLKSLASNLLRVLGTLPEQTQRELRKILLNKNSRFCVKPENFEFVISLWLSGESRDVIFTALPYVQRSSRKPKIQEWLSGTGEASSWDAEFDKFVDFTTGVFEDFLPWLMRACGGLSSFVEGWSASVNWRQYAEMMESGVDSQWAVDALHISRQISAPALSNRKAVAMVGREWPFMVVDSENDPLGFALLKDSGVRKRLDEMFQDILRKMDNPRSSVGRDIFSLRSWLWQQAGLRADEISL